MRLDQEIVQRGLCESRKEAQEMIKQGSVSVNGEVCLKQIREVNESDDIKLSSRRKYVSRGGLKLEGVLCDVFGDEKEVRRFCEAKSALDVGSSTGGFTDCLLLHGVLTIDAVDVGSAQAHTKIKNDNRVSVFENTDIRRFDGKKQYDIVVADLSFISLEDVLDVILSYGKSGGYYFLLLKPQFEVGPGNSKKGIVKNVALVNQVSKRYVELLEEKGLEEVRVFPSHVQGGDGNQEYFLVGIKK